MKDPDTDASERPLLSSLLTAAFWGAMLFFGPTRFGLWKFTEILSKKLDFGHNRVMIIGGLLLMFVTWKCLCCLFRQNSRKKIIDQNNFIRQKYPVFPA